MNDPTQLGQVCSGGNCAPESVAEMKLSHRDMLIAERRMFFYAYLTLSAAGAVLFAAGVVLLGVRRRS